MPSLIQQLISDMLQGDNPAYVYCVSHVYAGPLDHLNPLVRADLEQICYRDAVLRNVAVDQLNRTYSWLQNHTPSNDVNDREPMVRASDNHISLLEQGLEHYLVNPRGEITRADTWKMGVLYDVKRCHIALHDTRMFRDRLFSLHEEYQIAAFALLYTMDIIGNIMPDTTTPTS